MRENRQMYCAEEFHVIYVDTLPSRNYSITVHLLNVLNLVSHLKNYGIKREMQAHLQWRNLTNATSSKRSRLISIMISPVDSVYPWYDMLRIALHLCELSPKNSQP